MCADKKRLKMANLQRVYAALRKFVLAYPGGIAGVLGVVVALAARFGFHLTVTELMSVYAVAAAVIGTFVHFTVKAAIKNVKATFNKPESN